MNLALSLGRRAMGQTWPNPAVGCVIVKGARVVGRGWTQPGGRPHAEAQALTQAGTAARGAVAYVTLEPCAHHARTPPCAEALAAAGVERVVVATGDPDPRVGGKGFACLQSAGIAVQTGCCEAAARHDHRGFFLRTTEARPLVTLKLAQSADGRIATASGESRWITGARARHMVHASRARHDAVMIGSGTAAADDPMLNVRGLGMVRQPVRIVLDTGLGTDPESRLGQSAGDQPLWLCHGPGADPARRDRWERAGAQLVTCAAGKDGRLDVGDTMRQLARRGLTRIVCEGGGTLAAALLARGLVDEMVTFSAGLVLGSAGKAAVGAMPARALADHARFDLCEVRRIGPDAVTVWSRITV